MKRPDIDNQGENRSAPAGKPPAIAIKDLSMGYGDVVVQRDLTFDINRGDIFIIMGGSGCGKSTLLRHLVGLKKPEKGAILYQGIDFWAGTMATRREMMKNVGVLYQKGALWSSMTLAENIKLPLEEHTDLTRSRMDELAAFKLALVGLAGFEHHYPSQISGGMQKRAGLARAMALDPGILFFDEPSAGLDPVSARRLDDLILELNASLKATIVIVTHELDSIFAIGTNAVFLDPESKTMIATGDPKTMLETDVHEKVTTFLTRGRAEKVGKREVTP
ncbi:MAG TPA: ATP-binding cassette domain-containing protein [Desulfobacteraceae bacterium]|nr:ATP-binding cassette domain-containing protein [Desulfobacteraceae bacterium]